jgi:hypothetical protein
MAQVLRGAKLHYITIEVQRLPVPYWPETAPKNNWEEAHKHPKVVKYLPADWTREGKTVDRTFFWAIVSTLAPVFTRELIEDIRLQRAQRRVLPAPQQGINDIPMEIIDELLQHPYVSNAR